MDKKSGSSAKRIYVVAGTFEQFRHWQHENELGPNTEAVYVSSAERLLGILNPVVIYYGTFNLRGDLDLIQRAVAMMTR